MRTEPQSELALGFACAWDHPHPEATWSHTPWQLRLALQGMHDICVLDCGVDIHNLGRLALKAAYAKRAKGRWVTTWKYSTAWGRIAERSIRHEVGRHHPAALIEVGDLARVEQPFFVYQDLSYDLLQRSFPTESSDIPGFLGVSRRTLERRRERQHAVYESAAGIFCMSRWFADTLVGHGIVPEHRVHVIPPGRTAAGRVRIIEPRNNGARTNLLFVGRDFARKGGPLVVEAFRHCRREQPALTLTVAGPNSWPLPEEPPPGVRFVGPISPEEVARLIADADLFVMPSEFEAFGIVFVEALAAGVPVIGSAAFAMPEIIQAPRFGRLLVERDPRELASLILDALADDGLYARCEESRDAIAREYSWQACAERMVSIIRSNLGQFKLRDSTPPGEAVDPPRPLDDERGR